MPLQLLTTVDLVPAIFDVVGDAIVGFGGVIGDSFTGLVNIFYDSATGMTLVGTLALIGAGVGLVYWAFGMIRSMIRIR